MNALLEQVLSAKKERRKQLAALPFPEKVKIVEQLWKIVSDIRAAKAADGDDEMRSDMRSR